MIINKLEGNVTIGKPMFLEVAGALHFFGLKVHIGDNGSYPIASNFRVSSYKSAKPLLAAKEAEDAAADIIDRDGKAAAMAKFEERVRERMVQVAMLRDVVSDPLHPVALDPARPTSTALSLAQQMYDSRDFSPMTIFADALQDAGCEDQEILVHCRREGVHVRVADAWTC